MRKEKPGPQGLSNLKTWRQAFSGDVKRRRRQTLENRRLHRLRPVRPDSVLGTPELHWTEPPKLGPAGAARHASPKGRGAPEHEPVFFCRKVKRVRHRSLRREKGR